MRNQPTLMDSAAVSDGVPMDTGNKSSDSKVSRNYIHDDLAFSILSKLPIKSLKRFGCVRKSWSILFENSDFMTMYRNHFISHHHSSDHHHTFLLIHQLELPVTPDYRYHAELHLLESRVQLNLPPPFQVNDNHLSILGKTSVNGFFCIGQNELGGDSTEVRYVLWNPATEEFVVIPPSPDELVPKHPLLYVDHTFHGFGYDRVRDDFKVIQYVSFNNLDYFDDYDPDIPLPKGLEYHPFFEIYSVRNNSWKILDIIDTSPGFLGNTFTGIEGYMDGVCHWFAMGKKEKLVSFDLSDQMFITTPLDQKNDRCRRELAVLNGSIALISDYEDGNIFHISILGELGVKESWIKLFIYGPIPSIEWPPIGVGKKGYFFFRKEDDGELVRVDLSTQIIEELGVKGENCSYMIGIYKESLLSIGGSSN